MTLSIEREATAAMQAANLGCQYAANQTAGATYLGVENSRYSDAERVLNAVGLILEVFTPGDFLTFATITRVKASKKKA